MREHDALAREEAGGAEGHARRAGVGFVLRYPELVCTKLRARLEGRSGALLALLAIPCLGSAVDGGAGFCAGQAGNAGLLCYDDAWHLADDGAPGRCALPSQPATRGGKTERDERCSLDPANRIPRSLAARELQKAMAEGPENLVQRLMINPVYSCYCQQMMVDKQGSPSFYTDALFENFSDAAGQVCKVAEGARACNYY